MRCTLLVQAEADQRLFHFSLSFGYKFSVSPCCHDVDLCLFLCIFLKVCEEHRV